MARGNIYYVTTDKDSDVSHKAENYYDSLASLDLDHVKDAYQTAAKEALRWMNDTLYKLGASIGGSTAYGDFSFSFYFENVDKAKESWFAPKLEALKKEVEALTLSAVANAEPCLNQLNDEYGDLVTFNDGVTEITVTWDNFIRLLKPQTTYYVHKNIVLTH